MLSVLGWPLKLVRLRAAVVASPSFRCVAMRRDTARRHRKAAGGRLPASPQRDASSPSLKAHHPSSRLWQFLQLEFEIGSTFWPEVFSALSMTVPSVYAYYAAPELASISVFPEGIWALTIGTMVHCPFSVAYHLACAVLDSLHLFRGSHREIEDSIMHHERLACKRS